MKIIGLCGGSGAGKTTVSKILERCGAKLIDTDQVYREVASVGSLCVKELADAFGDDILLPNGELDRKKLASVVYNDSDKREMLNRITHRYIKDETVQRISAYEKNGELAVIVDAPLLFESGFDLLCDVKVGVIADEKLRIKRITSRDGITKEHASARIKAQYSDEYIRLRCEYILENNGDFSDVEREAVEIYEKIMSGIK